jgi:hypothetical protein
VCCRRWWLLTQALGAGAGGAGGGGSGGGGVPISVAVRALLSLGWPASPSDGVLLALARARA